MAEKPSTGWPQRVGKSTDAPVRSHKKARRRPWLALLLPLCVLFTPVHALGGQQPQPQNFAKPVGGISLEQAADTVRRQTGGRVLSATPVSKGGERGYNVRVLVDGKRVKQYYVDSEGRMSSR